MLLKTSRKPGSVDGQKLCVREAIAHWFSFWHVAMSNRRNRDAQTASIHTCHSHSSLDRIQLRRAAKPIMSLTPLRLVVECETRKNHRIDMESKRPATFFLSSTEEIHQRRKRTSAADNHFTCRCQSHSYEQQKRERESFSQSYIYSGMKHERDNRPVTRGHHHVQQQHQHTRPSR
jgi:hypothetical protein